MTTRSTGLIVAPLLFWLSPPPAELVKLPLFQAKAHVFEIAPCQALMTNLSDMLRPSPAFGGPPVVITKVFPDPFFPKICFNALRQKLLYTGRSLGDGIFPPVKDRLLRTGSDLEFFAVFSAPGKKRQIRNHQSKSLGWGGIFFPRYGPPLVLRGGCPHHPPHPCLPTSRSSWPLSNWTVPVTFGWGQLHGAVGSRNGSINTTAPKVSPLWVFFFRSSRY
jgi:hypothetical protein